ncbi:type I restriction endonuclease subunit R [Leucobacter sp. NPDC015123]|uniref:type I restriction endonuclease subunit R n=1 Tax=Leucobacter sp. NPDC015123 TaxID=3364129 RepID=UPI0036F45EE7
MAIHNEKPFEGEIVAALKQQGWLVSEGSKELYDKRLALIPNDVIGWLEDTQPEQLAKVIKPGDPAATQEKAKQGLLARLAKSLDRPLSSGGGTLAALRRGFKDAGTSFRMAQFQPADLLNPTTLADYGKMRLRVMRQVFYSTKNTNSIDLVLFVNGLPVATLELKTDFTQNVEDAKEQYRSDRAQQGEPLLSFGHRALVHFAVSNSEVWMTTRLAGQDTFFLPFNRGNDGAAGNPPNPDGAATAYLWEEVLRKDNWLGILQKFMHLQVEQQIDAVTGEVTRKETMLFPRYHQWQAVTSLVSTARSEGPGHRYLVQHSAGSGKTNSIAWTAHQLSTLHNDAGEKVFDSVFVISDRTVLDSQLQEAIRQIDAKDGVVTAITSKSGSKSEQLRAALAAGTPIIVVTIQTFPFVLNEMQTSAKLAGSNFAVIADEAHSSQTGTTANKVKEVLNPEELAELADGGEISTETLLAAEMENRAEAKNLSFFAFTATPKGKTLELFGRENADGIPQPFHLYSMQQAIEEGFILDVLKNYTPYKVAFKLAHDGQEYDSEGPLVEKPQAVKEMMHWVRLHDFNISQKVGIIVEHFLENVAWRLGGKAKAMVVTGTRQEAVRYKLAFDDYISRNGKRGVQVMVAFSGEVIDPEISPDPFTETTMNRGLKGRTLPEAFATDEFQIMLVANKFQTGFDQPLLVAMYVDKVLSGVSAVQTLSRLNRQARGKDVTFVLDFVNEPERILEAFQPYYRDATLTATSDPNVVHDLRDKLDAVGIYQLSEVDQAAEAQMRALGNHRLSAAIEPGRSRFNARYEAALLAEDALEIERLDLFRSDLTSFVNAYDFLSQVLNFGDTGIEKLALYARALAKTIKDSNRKQPIDLSEVKLLSYSIRQQQSHAIPLSGDAELEPAFTEAGSKVPKDPELTTLLAVVEQLNAMLDLDGLTATDTRNVLTHVVERTLENETVEQQRRVNSEQQFLESPALRTQGISALIDATNNVERIRDALLSDDQKFDAFMRAVGQLAYGWGRDAA